MKRTAIVAAAALLAGGSAVEQQIDETECKAPCALEPVATVPEQLHSLEDLTTNSLADQDFVYFAASPVVRFPRGSKEHLDWVRKGVELWEPNL